ncbi:uridine kinase family protein [Streptomyces rubiginosohelvolus]
MTTTTSHPETAEHVPAQTPLQRSPHIGGTFLPAGHPPLRTNGEAGPGHRAPVLAIAGGTASGKSTVAEALAAQWPTTVTLIHLDDFYVPAHEPHRGVRTLSATGVETLDWNHPGSIDVDAAAAEIEAAATSGRHRIVVVEGLFALTLHKIAAHATWRIYVDAPDDIRLARKLVRKIEVQHQDPLVSLRNYLLIGRDRHAEHVAPSRHRADLVLDGTMPTADLLTAINQLVGAHLPITT